MAVRDISKVSTYLQRLAAAHCTALHGAADPCSRYLHSHPAGWVQGRGAVGAVSSVWPRTSVSDGLQSAVHVSGGHVSLVSPPLQSPVCISTPFANPVPTVMGCGAVTCFRG